jgi:hypothetical protein
MTVRLSETRETSGATTRLVLRFVRDRRGDAAVRRVLQHAGLSAPLEELEQESTWISYAQRIRLFAAAVEVVDEPDVMFQIGASGLRQSANPALMLMLRALGSPRHVTPGCGRTAWFPGRRRSSRRCSTTRAPSSSILRRRIPPCDACSPTRALARSPSPRCSPTVGSWAW